MSSTLKPHSLGSSRTILGHPPGLFVLFFTEMWERFAFYGMRSLLVLYMVNFLFLQPDVGQRVLGFTAVRGALESIFGHLDAQPLSSQIYGLYIAFVYLTPIFGGMLADRVLGQRKSVILGGILMAIGEFVLMSPKAFFVGLLVMILGNGAFKPNISTQVGGLYPEGDPRRDGAFTIFYMGINVGAFLSPLICGTLGQVFGWRYGFLAAGIGMILGLIFYLWGQRYLATDHLTRRKQSAAVAVREKMSPEEWWRVIALMVLCGINSFFWAIYEQQGNTMQLWADQHTSWRFFGINIPSTWYQAFNPLMIFTFAPLLTMVWTWQSRRRQEPSSVSKMAWGCLLLGLSFIVMIAAAQGMAPDARRSVLWLVGATVVITLGELYLSPVGLSFVTKVAPARMVSMMMGMWFLSNFVGNYLSGFLGTFWEKIPHTSFFMLMTGIGVGAGVLMFAAGPVLQRLTGGNDKRVVVETGPGLETLAVSEATTSS